ncbi:MAG TPA: methionine adenosyltransferase, partial [Gemmatimonadaceae bacterium]
QCGAVLHHNVDKVLLAAGSSAPRFGGGEVIAPMEIYLAGRATHEVDGTVIPVAGRSPRIESTQRLARGPAFCTREPRQP